MSFIDKKMIAQSFGLAANTYDSVAHFQRWVGEKLMEKIPDCSPETIVDLGCGTGYFSESLSNKYPNASYIGMDLSESMARFAKGHHVSEYSWVTGDAESLTFRDGSIDLIFSSLAIQWCANLPLLMKEIKRVLSPKGIFVFSTLLDGSLAELKSAWSEVDDHQHVNDFFLKEDYQQAVLESGLAIKLLSEETKILKYQKLTELMRELKELGAHNLNAQRSIGLMGRNKLSGVISVYEKFRVNQSYLPASYEVLWGVLIKGSGSEITLIEPVEIC
ncbi:MAG: malonyl-CoA O-methyltransferase [Oleiphilaceae bacterium]|jgi:malonyl-CoA O-methyltransferase